MQDENSVKKFKVINFYFKVKSLFKTIANCAIKNLILTKTSLESPFCCFHKKKKKSSDKNLIKKICVLSVKEVLSLEHNIPSYF